MNIAKIGQGFFAGHTAAKITAVFSIFLILALAAIFIGMAGIIRKNDDVAYAATAYLSSCAAANTSCDGYFKDDTACDCVGDGGQVVCDSNDPNTQKWQRVDSIINACKSASLPHLNIGKSHEASGAAASELKAVNEPLVLLSGGGNKYEDYTSESSGVCSTTGYRYGCACAGATGGSLTLSQTKNCKLYCNNSSRWIFANGGCAGTDECASICKDTSNTCTNPGSIVNSLKKDDGATYLQVCGTDKQKTEIQCSLTLKQKEAAACYEAQTNGLAAAIAKIESSDGFSIQKDPLLVGFAIIDPYGSTNCEGFTDLKSREDVAQEVRAEKLNCASDGQTSAAGSACQNVELACCLTGDKCMSYGCDENIVYDWYYGCTKVDFGKAVAGGKIGGAGACQICAKSTYGCGTGISSTGAYKSCEKSTDAANPNLYCWSTAEKKCNPYDACSTNDLGQSYCAAFDCDKSGTASQTWDSAAGGKKCQAGKTTSIVTNICPKTQCNFASGEIKVWDGKSKSESCAYIKSTDAKQSSCATCHVDSATKEAVCDTPATETTCIVGYNQCNASKQRVQCVKDKDGKTSWSTTAIPCQPNYTCVGTVTPKDGTYAGKTMYAVCCNASTYDSATACYDEAGRVLKNTPKPQTTEASCKANGGQWCGNACAYSSGMQSCNGKDVACDCAKTKTNGQPSCQAYPNDRCSSDLSGFDTLNPVSNYCAYAIHTSCTTGTVCKQLTTPVGGKYAQCVKKEQEKTTECAVPSVDTKHTWQGDNLIVKATTDVKAQCKFDVNNVDYNNMQWSMQDADSSGYASDGKQHQGTVSASSVTAQTGDQSSQQSNQSNNQNSNSDNQSTSQTSQSVRVWVACKNVESGCENKNAVSTPQSEDCGETPGSQNNSGQNQNQNQNQNQTPLTVSSCEAQGSGTGSSATVKLSATTNGPATCTYAVNGAGGKAMQTTDNKQYTDNVVASSLQAGNNSFTITCQAGTSNNSSNNNNNKSNNNSNSQTFTGTATCSATYSNSSANAPQISNCSAVLGTGTNSTVLQVKAITQTNAACSYGVNTDKGTVAAGQAMQTTDKLSHADNVQLTALQSGNNVIYVRCKSSETNGAENQNPCQVQYQNTGGAITISNPLPSGTVTSSPVTLSAVTNLAATCRFSSTDQDYNSMPSANQFVQTQQGDSKFAQQYQMAVENSKNYQFFVRCRDGSGNVSSSSTTITFSTSLTGAGLLAIANPQPTGNVTGSQITISVQTSVNAACTYTKDNSQKPFENTGGVYHSSPVTITTAGPQTFQVACVNSANANDRQSATIAFTANLSGPSDCAQVAAQDKKPDSQLGNVDSYNSSYDYEGNNTSSYNSDSSSNAQYMWQALDSGTLGQFSHVNWNAGYHFKPNDDGYITELCGFFDNANTDSKVVLYDGSFHSLASVSVKDSNSWSFNSWNCKTISPVQVQAKQDYYVAAKVDNGPIYYKNQNNMLPKQGTNFTIIEGVRELDDEPFGTKITPYPYMVFGLVDARFALDMGSVGYGNDQGAPKMSDPLPSGNINTNAPVLHLQTANNAFCKFDRWDRTWENMHYTFSTSGGRVHEQKVCDLINGEYTYFVRCSHNGQSDTKSLRIRFTVQSSGGDSGEPQLTNPKPTGTINTRNVIISVNTPASASAQCKFDTNDVSYNSMGNGMSAQTDPANSNLILNSASIGNMNDGNYTYYVRCRDYLGNTNTTSAVVSFRISGSQSNDATPPQISNGHVSNSSASVGSTIRIIAQVSDNQGVASVIAKIRNSSGQIMGSLTLYDDGDRDDGTSGNGVFGNSWTTSGMSSGTYYVDITALDNSGNSTSQSNIANIVLN